MQALEHGEPRSAEKPALLETLGRMAGKAASEKPQRKTKPSAARIKAALAVLADPTVTLPPEPRGADLTWRAIEHERGYDDLDRDDPTSGDEWKGGR